MAAQLRARFGASYFRAAVETLGLAGARQVKSEKP
jgi:hypothetical protein